MQKIILAVALLVVGFGMAFGAPLKSDKETRSLSDNVMASIGKGDMKTAFDTIKPYIGISETEMESLLLQTKTMREQYQERFGKTFSYEYIDTIKVGNSLIRHQYIEKTDKTAFAWKLIFYKNNEGWIIIGFKWGDVEKELCWH